MARYEVRHFDPSRQRMLILAALVVLLVLLAASFWFGQYRSGIDHTNLEARVDVLNEQLKQSRSGEKDLRNENSMLKRSSEIDGAALQAAKEELNAIQDDMVELKEELVFYQSLLSPAERQPGLHVQDLDLVAAEDGSYHYTLILTQVRQNDRFAKGNVVLGLPVEQVETDGETGVPAMEIATPLDKQEFKFKFFQRIEGQLILPEGVQPSELLVKVKPIGRRLKGFDQQYSWTTLIGGSI